jgi:hypothetical protein
LYTSGDLTVSGLQLRISENMNPFSEASTPVIYPIQLSASLLLSRMVDRLLPSLRVAATSSDVDARVGAQQLKVLQNVLSKLESSARFHSHATTSPAIHSGCIHGWPDITPRSFGEVGHKCKREPVCCQAMKSCGKLSSRCLF